MLSAVVRGSIPAGRALRARALSALTKPPPPGYKPFRLPDAFVDGYASREPEFGFNGLGKLVYERTYARPTLDGGREQWLETVERVVNGTFNMQKRWIEEQELGWDEEESQAVAQDMYERIFTMKFLPPGRGLWAMGSAITEERRLFAALNNCAFVSTDKLASDFAGPFVFLMEAAMLGVGVGFDTKGAGSVNIVPPDGGAYDSGPSTAAQGTAAAAEALAAARAAEVVGADSLSGDGLSVTATGGLSYTIADSREGWVRSLKLLLESYVHGNGPVAFDYSLVRPAGQPIKGFGGVASGPGPLREMHEACRAVLDGNVGKPLTVTTIVDLMNLVGKCVVAGNVRRTAEIAFGDPHSDEYIDLKNYDKNPARMAHGWTSNNSVFAELGMRYDHLVPRITANGEPGFAWLHNMRNYGRMNGTPDSSDWRASGGNPCLEQTLESYELCCLVETFPNRHQSVADFEKTLEAAFLYAKTVTLGETHWAASNRVMLRNRRIGCSISGVAQFISSRSLGELQEWCERGYTTLKETDARVSDRFGVPKSIKLTSVKPSGSVSLLAGATPGLHYPESRFYRRRVRLPRSSPLLPRLEAAGLKIEPAVGDEAQTLVVEFPVDAGEGLRSVHELSMWEQLSLAAFLQRHWADNQVSCTVTFDPETEGPSLASALDYFQYQLKGISFLPRLADSTAYAQMPYERIDEATYRELMASVRLEKLNADEPRRRRPRAAAAAVAGASAADAAGGSVGAVGGAGTAAGARERAMAQAAVPECVPVDDALPTLVDHTPDVFCDSDRCVQEEMRSLASTMAAGSAAAMEAGGGGGAPGMRRGVDGGLDELAAGGSGARRRQR